MKADYKELKDYKIKGNFHQDSDFFDAVIEFVKSRSGTVEQRAEMIKKYDEAMGMDSPDLRPADQITDFLASLDESKLDERLNEAMEITKTSIPKMAVIGSYNVSESIDATTTNPGDKLAIDHKKWGKINVVVTKVVGDMVYWKDPLRGIMGGVKANSDMVTSDLAKGRPKTTLKEGNFKFKTVDDFTDWFDQNDSIDAEGQTDEFLKQGIKSKDIEYFVDMLKKEEERGELSVTDNTYQKILYVYMNLDEGLFGSDKDEVAVSMPKGQDDDFKKKVKDIDPNAKFSTFIPITKINTGVIVKTEKPEEITKLARDNRFGVKSTKNLGIAPSPMAASLQENEENLTPQEKAFVDKHDDEKNYKARSKHFDDMYAWLKDQGIEDDSMLDAFRKLDDEGKKKALAFVGVDDISAYENDNPVIKWPKKFDYYAFTDWLNSQGFEDGVDFTITRDSITILNPDISDPVSMYIAGGGRANESNGETFEIEVSLRYASQAADIFNDIKHNLKKIKPTSTNSWMTSDEDEYDTFIDSLKSAGIPANEIEVNGENLSESTNEALSNDEQSVIVDWQSYVDGGDYTKQEAFTEIMNTYDDVSLTPGVIAKLKQLVSGLNEGFEHDKLFIDWYKSSYKDGEIFSYDKKNRELSIFNDNGEEIEKITYQELQGKIPGFPDDPKQIYFLGEGKKMRISETNTLAELDAGDLNIDDMAFRLSQMSGSPVSDRVIYALENKDIEDLIKITGKSEEEIFEACPELKEKVEETIYKDPVSLWELDDADQAASKLEEYFKMSYPQADQKKIEGHIDSIMYDKATKGYISDSDGITEIAKLVGISAEELADELTVDAPPIFEARVDEKLSWSQYLKDLGYDAGKFKKLDQNSHDKFMGWYKESADASEFEQNYLEDLEREITKIPIGEAAKFDASKLIPFSAIMKDWKEDWEKSELNNAMKGIPGGEWIDVTTGGDEDAMIFTNQQFVKDVAEDAIMFMTWGDTYYDPAKKDIITVVQNRSGDEVGVYWNKGKGDDELEKVMDEGFKVDEGQAYHFQNQITGAQIDQILADDEAAAKYAERLGAKWALKEEKTNEEDGTDINIIAKKYGAELQKMQDEKFDKSLGKKFIRYNLVFKNEADLKKFTDEMSGNKNFVINNTPSSVVANVDVINEMLITDSEYIQNSLKRHIEDIKDDNPEYVEVLEYVINRLNQSYPQGDITKENLLDILSEPSIRKAVSNIKGMIKDEVVDDIMNEAKQTANERDYSEDERQSFADKGWALPDGSFPIADEEDFDNAINLAHKANDIKAAQAHIKKRAKELGLEDKIPETWESINEESKEELLAKMNDMAKTKYGKDYLTVPHDKAAQEIDGYKELYDKYKDVSEGFGSYAYIMDFTYPEKVKSVISDAIQLSFNPDKSELMAAMDEIGGLSINIDTGEIDSNSASQEMADMMGVDQKQFEQVVSNALAENDQVLESIQIDEGLDAGEIAEILTVTNQKEMEISADQITPEIVKEFNSRWDELKKKFPDYSPFETKDEGEALDMNVDITNDTIEKIK